MNKIILAATLLAVSSALSAQQQNTPDRPTTQSNNPSTRTNEGGSSYNDQKAPARAIAPAATSNSAATPAAPASRAASDTRSTTTNTNTNTTTTTADPVTPARRERVARAPRADRN